MSGNRVNAAFCVMIKLFILPSDRWKSESDPIGLRYFSILFQIYVFEVFICFVCSCDGYWATSCYVSVTKLQKTP